MTPSKINQEKTVADFFAGIGLVGAGLKRRKWKMKYAVDNDPQKKEMYEHHFGNAPYYDSRDIARVSGNDIPTVTLAHASFPCTDTSLAGSRSGIYGDGESPTYWEFVHILKEMASRRPPLVTVENVEALLTSGEGEDLEAALRALNELGYAVDVLIIDASHFVPQSRVRLFVIAQQNEEDDRLQQERILKRSGTARPEKIRDFIRSHPNIEWNLRNLPSLPRRELDLRDVVDKEDNDWWEEDRAEYLFSQMYKRHEKSVEEMMGSDEWHYGTVFRRTRKRDGKRQSTAELRTDGLAGCLRTPKGGSARQILVRAGKGQRDARLLNARECARLMGVPEFRLSKDSSLTQHLWGFGDAVCAPVVEWLSKHYLEPVLQDGISSSENATPDPDNYTQRNQGMDVTQSPSRLRINNIDSLPEEGERALEEFKAWCGRHHEGGSLPSRGRNYGALVTLNRLREDYDLNVNAHKTASGKQVKRQTNHNVSNILQEFGEEREPLSEAGRTSRGSLDAVEDLLDTLQETNLQDLDQQERHSVLTQMMNHCVWVESEYHERERVEFDYSPIDDPTKVVSRILSEASNRKRGAIAQHLVGAKLDVRLSQTAVPNHSYTTADDQTKRRGDFDIEDTVFHVTVAPSDSVYQKCNSDLKRGSNVYLLVTNDVRLGAERTVHEQYSENIKVRSVENFVGQNLDEMSSFSRKEAESTIEEVIEKYNERVEQVEQDQSLKIKKPENMNG